MSYEDIKDYVESVADKATSQNFYSFLRNLEALAKDKPRIGYSSSLRQEIVGFSQPAHLEFAPSTISSIELVPLRRKGGPFARMEIFFFGLSGPNGALPYAITDYILSRKNGLTHPDRVVEGRRDMTLNRRDSSLYDFLNIFNHRFISYYYRSWATARKTVDFDRPNEAKYEERLASLIGVAGQSMPGRNSSNNYFSGYYANQVRSPSGIVNILSDLLSCAVRVEENVGHWISIPDEDKQSLGSLASLGDGLVLGDKVWDRQLRFDLHIGPVEFSLFEHFISEDELKIAPIVKEIKHLVSLYTNRAFFCFAHIELLKEEIPSPILGSENHLRLGIDSWIGDKSKHVHHPKNLTIQLT